MDINEFIDWDERDFPETESAAVLECVNCRRTVERLHHVPEFNYLGCDDCLAEAMAVIEHDRKQEHEAMRNHLIAQGWKPFDQGFINKRNDLYVDLSGFFGFAWELMQFSDRRDGVIWAPLNEGNTLAELEELV